MNIFYKTLIGINKEQRFHEPKQYTSHPENPKRIEAIIAHLKQTGLMEKFQCIMVY